MHPNPTELLAPKPYRLGLKLRGHGVPMGLLDVSNFSVERYRHVYYYYDTLSTEPLPIFP
jgi:hypothetical protein